MEPAYITAFAALAGSLIGGLTSLAASWLSQHVQVREQQRVQDLNKREELYKDFIEEASKLYVDAYEHDKAEVSNLINLYALVSRMRVLSSPRLWRARTGLCARSSRPISRRTKLFAMSRRS
jgi:hypothetical protein